MTGDKSNILGRVAVTLAPIMRAAVLAAFLPSVCVAQDRFPDDMWAPDLLLTLAAGPAFLSPRLDLGVLPPPGPEETRSELDRMELMFAQLRNGPTETRIRLEATADPVELLYGAGLVPPPSSGANLWWVLGQVRDEAAYFVLREKRRFARLRPSALRPEMGSTIPDPPHPAYPSGHATQIYALSGLLSRMQPACEGDYRRFAAGVAFRREVAGVHFPSDTLAGERLASALIPEIMAHPDIAVPLIQAEEELRLFTSLSGCSAQEAPR